MADDRDPWGQGRLPSEGIQVPQPPKKGLAELILRSFFAVIVFLPMAAALGILCGVFVRGYLWVMGL